MAKQAKAIEEFKPLEKEYKKYGYKFKQVKREGMVAMYEQWSVEDGEEEVLVGYEVFEVIYMPAGFAGPKRYPQPAREVPPNTEAWGQKGYSPVTREKAELRFQQLIKRLELRETEQSNAKKKGTLKSNETKSSRKV